MISAWNNLSNFEEGTNLKAWLFTILRNNFYNGLRKLKHQSDYARTMDNSQFVVPASQDKTIEFGDMMRSLEELPPDQREALILVTVENMSYEEVAAICDCPVGTIKSRVNRARARLEALMERSAIRNGRQDLNPPASHLYLAFSGFNNFFVFRSELCLGPCISRSARTRAWAAY